MNFEQRDGIETSFILSTHHDRQRHLCVIKVIIDRGLFLDFLIVLRIESRVLHNTLQLSYTPNSREYSLCLTGFKN